MAFYLSKLALIAVIIAIFGQETAAGQRCLALVGDKNYLFNLDTGQLTDVAPVKDASFSNNDMPDRALSPDRQHLVSVEHHIQNVQFVPEMPLKLSVKKFDRPIPFRQFYPPSLTGIRPGHAYWEMSWSPNSPRFLYSHTEW